MSEIKSLHRKMQSWFAREKKNGFRSPEVEHAATYVLHGLYSFAHNDPHPRLHPIFKSSLAADVERWRKAMGQ